MLMKLLCSSRTKRHYCTFLSPASRESEIIQLCNSGHLLKALKLLNSLGSPEGITAKPILYATLVQGCTKANFFNLGLQFHAHVIKAGLDVDRFVGNSLLALYFKLGRNFFETRRLFDGLVYKDVVSWSSIISGYIRVGKPQLSLALYVEMLDFGVEPNAFTLSTLIKACSELRELRLGQCFHGAVITRGFDDSRVIVSGLIDMYGKNFEAGDARKLFYEMPLVDDFCWTSVISALTKNDLFGEALKIFHSGHRNHKLLPSAHTFGSVLTAVGNLGRLKQGKQLHAKVVALEICGDIFVDSSLVDMYAKCGLINESRCVFDGMAERNSVSWCALLTGYCHKGDFDTVIELFRMMEEVELYSFGTVIRACSGLAALKPGKEVHCQFLRRGGFRDIVVESALVDLYAKCGCFDAAYNVFVRMPARNVVSWNSMISGFAQNGRGEEAIKMFNKMISEDIKPDYITFVSVISACSHTGLVDMGRKYFGLMMDDYKIKPKLEHYGCMIDLLCRAGELEEAECLINSSEFKNDPSLWTCLLGACSNTTDPTVAQRIAKKMIELKPEYHLSYVYLSNVYKAIGRWDDALKVWWEMQHKRVKKIPGKSWVESNKNLGHLSTNPSEENNSEVVKSLM
nr:pentatricopeptide repeat-containing protein At1g03540 [Ipomoea batatas]